jgi:hypothetical protein
MQLNKQGLGYSKKIIFPFYNYQIYTDYNPDQQANKH